MGWTAPRTWIAGEIPTAAIFNQHLRDNLIAMNGIVRKTATESVAASTVLQNDDQLAYAIGGSGVYLIDLYLVATSNANATGDLVVGFSFPTGTLTTFVHAADASLPSGSTAVTGAYTGVQSAVSGGGIATVGTSTAPVGIWIHGQLVASAPGTLQVLWAQATASGTTNVLGGSHMTVQQVS